MGEFVRLSDVRGFKRALEICERMMESAPAALKYEVCTNGSKCQGTGYVEIRPNVVKICECRQAAINAARRRQDEAFRPQKDVVDFLLADDEES